MSTGVFTIIQTLENDRGAFSPLEIKFELLEFLFDWYCTHHKSLIQCTCCLMSGSSAHVCY